MLQKIMSDWWQAIKLKNTIDPVTIDDRNANALIRSAITVARCAEPQRLPATEINVEFPTIDGRFNFAQTSSFAVQILNRTSTNHLRFQWVHLPNNFGAASIGAVFESAWDQQEQSRLVVGCTLQCGWVPTSVYTDEYSFWTGWYPWDIDYGDRTPAWESEVDAVSPATNGRIALGDTWLDLLTTTSIRPAPNEGDRQLSTIESILINAGFANDTNFADDWQQQNDPGQGRTSFLEAIICSIVVDGLSRTGSYRIFNTSGSNKEWTLSPYEQRPDFNQRILAGETAFEVPDVVSGFTTLHVTMNITGIAFRRSLSTYLAMSVLFTHTVMAVAHMLWVVCNKRTSRSWTSVSELVALAQNSQPALDTLSNTSAGIKSRTTFARVAKIRVRSQAGHPAKDHLELVFDGNSNGSQPSTDSEEQLAELYPRRHIRTPSTWPRSSDRLSVPSLSEPESRSSSTDRLIPRVYFSDAEKGGIVQVNRAYS